MPDTERRTVGERGQVTLPKEFREEFGLHGGDEVTIRKESGQIVIEKPVSRDDLAEGYCRRADQHGALAAELSDVSREADGTLGDVPEW